jgi:hypothetical protein
MPPEHDDGSEEEEVTDPGDTGDEVDEPDDEDDEDDDGDDDGDEKDDEPLGAPGKKALTAERAKVKELRKQLREATAAGKKKDQDDDGGDAEEKAAAKWKPRVVNSAARAAFLEAGAERPERLLKLLDLDELDVTEKGNVEGLEEEVDRLKEEYPELFSKRRSGRRVETGDRSGNGSTRKKMTATERQAAQLAGSVK